MRPGSTTPNDKPSRRLADSMRPAPRRDSGRRQVRIRTISSLRREHDRTQRPPPVVDAPQDASEPESAGSSPADSDVSDGRAWLSSLLSRFVG